MSFRFALPHELRGAVSQTAGDLAVLESRGRRAVRVHLGADVATGLKTLASAVEAALA